jgi:predicted XRE-type DNA-binding protein
MQFADRLRQIEVLAKEIIRHIVENKYLMQKDIARRVKIDERRLKQFYDGDLKLKFSETITLIDFVAKTDFGQIFDEDDELRLNVTNLIHACDFSFNQDVDLRTMFLKPTIAGDSADFAQLEGDYYVLRRIYGKSKILLSIVSIIYDPENNRCTWHNVHNQGVRVTVGGRVTESGGVFYFVGFVDKTSVVQTMSVPKPLIDWNVISGLVLTQTGPNQIASRVALVRIRISMADAIGKCGEVSPEDAKALGLVSAEFLDNTCPQDGVLTPVVAF